MSFYQGLLADQPRLDGFRSLIHAAVSPGDVVVEIGSGLGTFSFFAAEAGARAVWGIESDPIVHVAQQIAQTNGLSERVRFLRGKAPDVPVPEKADALIFEDFPSRLLDQQTVGLLRACAARYLKPGGRVIPAWARVMLAPVSSATIWSDLFPFGADPFEAYGIDFAAAAGYTENAPTVLSLPAGSLCAPPRTLSEVPIHPCPTPDRLGGSAAWPLEGGPVHGLAYWFELSAGEGRWIAPPADGASPGGGAWGQVFLPFRSPIEAAAGAVLRAEINVHAFSDSTPGWISWTAEADAEQRAGHEFGAEPASLADLYPPSDEPSSSHRGREPAPDISETDTRPPSVDPPTTPPPLQ